MGPEKQLQRLQGHLIIYPETNWSPTSPGGQRVSTAASTDACSTHPAPNLLQRGSQEKQVSQSCSHAIIIILLYSLLLLVLQGILIHLRQRRWESPRPAEQQHQQQHQTCGGPESSVSLQTQSGCLPSGRLIVFLQLLGEEHWCPLTFLSSKPQLCYSIPDC